IATGIRIPSSASAQRSRFTAASTLEVRAGELDQLGDVGLRVVVPVEGEEAQRAGGRARRDREPELPALFYLLLHTLAVLALRAGRLLLDDREPASGGPDLGDADVDPRDRTGREDELVAVLALGRLVDEVQDERDPRLLDRGRQLLDDRGVLVGHA